MTPLERRKPDLIKATRKRRIAAGAGVQVQEVNRMLKEFEQMQDMMKKMKGGGMMKMMKRMGGMKGMPKMPKNIESALKQANSSLNDVVRVTYVLPNGAEFEQCWPVLRKYFGEVRPAAMMISASLLDPRMKIEIEVTALRQK
jgi:hypothetical protein